MSNKNMKVHFMSNSNEWGTPQEFFNRLNKEFCFTLDPCSDGKNNKCSFFYTEKDDGLSQDWGGHRVFMNPPYGRVIKDWVAKAYKESQKPNTLVVGLIPARTDTQYWHEYIFNKAKEIRFIKGRLKFGDGKNSAPFPSAVIIWEYNKKAETKFSTMTNYIK